MYAFCVEGTKKEETERERERDREGKSGVEGESEH